ncbi:dihydrofolate synthase / folylpolyglutamate synthase [Mariniphaga anaerophila]|uniref:Dihydrofolate synthase/folylpolyglutamate synthase n=1 Tax=Mariniphaga anaerophila TaxID=1484053 RepID=A0A1M4Y8R5_9BACT|nr:folylpolyglutamate synthase/dihydrofolate synthase family protein [Mariniphaga anaerophila]SHF02040.1 dihydrofolate synthase / folylpolyglutamate synthase [Mariniphaga anaerophila]
MDYSDTLEFLFSRLPMFQRIGPAAYKDNLDNTVKLDDFFGNPSRKFKTIHVAGTNGKGSVSHMLAAVLQAAGYKTGLYTSPHLKDFRERIRINGEMISTDEVVAWTEKYRANNELLNIDPSFFELTVSMAFDYFAREKVDVAVVEVGLGGRLDSTNIITPEVSVITNIGMDHISLLGDSLEKIAQEKAGIIKAGIPVVIGTTQVETKKVFDEVAALKLAPIFFADQEYEVMYGMTDLDGNQLLSVRKDGKKLYNQLKLDLKGMYQKLNLPPVLKTVELLRDMGWDISEENMLRGLASARKMTNLMGRWQVLGYNPLLVCDTGHNAEGMKEVVYQMSQTPYEKLHIVLGVVKDKNPERLLSLMPTDAEYYFTRAGIPRAMEEKELARIAAGFGLHGSTSSSVSKAFDAARGNAGKNDMVFVGGSTFIVAEIL